MRIPGGGLLGSGSIWSERLKFAITRLRGQFTKWRFLINRKVDRYPLDHRTPLVEWLQLLHITGTITRKRWGNSLGWISECMYPLEGDLSISGLKDAATFFVRFSSRLRLPE